MNEMNFVQLRKWGILQEVATVSVQADVSGSVQGGFYGPILAIRTL